MSKRFIIITIFFTVIGFIFQYLLSNAISLIVCILEMVTIAAIGSGVGYLFSNAKKDFYFSFCKLFLIFGAIIGTLSSIIIIFSFYHNTFPGAIGKITLTDGKNSIIFYQMSHIATPSFYKEVSLGISTLSNSGYVIYAEGVRPGSAENHEKFNKLLGIKLGTGTYDLIAETIGLNAQDESLFSGVQKTSLENVDISIDDIMNIVGTGVVSSNQDSPVDIESELSVFQGKLKSNLLGYIFRGILNFSIKGDTTVEVFSGAFNPQLFDVIVSKRNNFIVDYYYSHLPQKAIFVYGALHFQGVYSLLRDRNPNWRIDSIEPIYPYKF